MNPEFGNRSINNLGRVDIETLSGGAESFITSVRYEIENESGGAGGFQFNRAEGSPVPEPATAGFVMIAALALLKRRR
jgi:hypothetical protein